MENSKFNFGNPPIVEVVFGVLFSPAKPLQGVHIGAFWSEIKKDFPKVREVQPLPPIVEPNDPFATEQGLIFTDNFPIRRAWLISQDEHVLLQIQEDRFLFNWKRTPKIKEYPRYNRLYQLFIAEFLRFCDFCERCDIGPLEFRQFELSYINIIGHENGYDGDDGLSVLVDHKPAAAKGRFLPPPETVNLTRTYVMPDSSGRLRVVAVTGSHPNGSKLLRLELTARGLPRDPSSFECIEPWFSLGHDWITSGFVDLTDRETQVSKWEKQ